VERGFGGVCAAGAARIQHRRAAELGWEEACGGVLGCPRELGRLGSGLKRSLGR